MEEIRAGLVLGHGPATVSVEDGTVRAVAGAPPDAGWPGLLTPGLVDLQVNGCFGVDLAAATPDEWCAVSRRLVATGVTAYLPTFVTAPVADLGAALDRAYAAMQAQAERLADPAAPAEARILGAHLEGPFLSPLRAGAHDPAFMRDPDAAALDELLRTGERRAVLRVMTLAPERPGAGEAIRRLTSAGVLVSLGHSDADGAQAAAAVDAGATLVTHLFNAMRPLDHRCATLVSTALTDERLSLGMIADLHHLDPDVLAVVLRLAGDRTVLVSDAVAAAGLPPGTYELGGAPVTTTTTDPLPRRADGVLAGSVLRLDHAVRNVVGLGVDLAVAVHAATRNPARAVGRPELGSIRVGGPADLVLWGDGLEIRQVWAGGRPALPVVGPEVSTRP